MGWEGFNVTLFSELAHATFQFGGNLKEHGRVSFRESGHDIREFKGGELQKRSQERDEGVSMVAFNTLRTEVRNNEADLI